MLYLDAVLAFAFTMLVVATAVSKFVDFVFGVLALRNRLFELMLSQVESLVAAEANEKLVEVQAVIKSAVDKEGRTWLQWLWRYVSGQLPASLSREQFVNLIAASGASQETIGKIEACFSACEDKLTNYLRQRSRWVATTVAFVLALALNIDSVNILDTYIHTPALSGALASDSKEALKKSQDALSAVDQLKNDETAGQKKVATDLQSATKELQTEIDKINNSSFPIGHSYFPFRPYTPTAAPSWEARMRWIAGILLTCLCAGLGAPFWYDLIQNLTQLTQSKNADKSKPDDKVVVAIPVATAAQPVPAVVAPIPEKIANS